MLDNPILKRRSDESLKEWKIRLCENKTQYNLTWDQIKDIINKETGDNFGESVYRKWWASFKEGFEYAQQKGVDSQEILEEIETKKLELEKLKVQFQDQRREYKKYLRHDARLDYLLQTLLESIKEDIHNKKPLIWYKKYNPLANTKKALALLISDVHKGLKTNNHWNVYNNEIFYERLNQIINETIEYNKLHNVNSLHIFKLGDLVHGLIHRLTRLGDTEDVIKATQIVAEALSEMVSVFANEFNEVHLYSVRGNHDRVAARKEEEIRTESFHDFIPWYMKARLEKFKNVIFHENEYDDEIIVAEILGNTYFGVHGHLDSLNKVTYNLPLMLKRIPTAIFSAHIHKNFEDEVHGIDLIINGPFAGTDDYAKDKRLTSKPHQKLILLDEKGRADTHYIRFY